MSKTDPLTHGRAARLSLPFLPTLVMALMLGTASLMCPEPGAEPPAVPAAASIAPGDFHPAVPMEVPLPRAPAMIAFAEQYPLSLAPSEPRAATTLRPAVRLASVRRPCAAPHCAEAAVRRPDPFSPLARPDPVRATSEARAAAQTMAQGGVQLEAEAETETAGGLLPDIALPFAPVTRVVGEAANFVRTGAASIGGSVSMMADRLR